MNATQYYIIDSFIKNQKAEHELIPNEDEDHAREDEPYEDPLSGSSDEIHSGDEDDEVAAKTDDEGKEAAKENLKRKSSGSGERSPTNPGLMMGNKDYDPMYDGESSPTVVGSASGSERER